MGFEGARVPVRFANFDRVAFGCLALSAGGAFECASVVPTTAVGLGAAQRAAQSSWEQLGNRCKYLKSWRVRQDLNLQPSDPKSEALSN